MADGGPNINTNLYTPPPGGGLLGGMGVLDIMRMRQLQNENILFQQQMSARHQMGQDLATLGSQGMGDSQMLDVISKSPYAPFVAPEIGMYRQSALAQTQMAEVQQRMNSAGLGTLAQALIASGGDPTKFGSSFNAAMATMPESTQKALTKAKSAIIDSLAGDLSKSPEDRQKYTDRLRNWAVALGIPPAAAYALAPAGGAFGAIPPTTAAGKFGPGGAETVVPIGGGREMGAQGAGGGAVPGAGPAPGASPSPSGVPTGLSASGTTTAQALGTDAADYKTRLVGATTLGATMLKSVAEQDNLLKQFRAGGGATARTNLARLAQAIIPEDFKSSTGATKQQIVDDIGNGNLAASQEFEKLSVNNIMGQIQQQLPQTSRLAVQEFNVFRANNPNLETDPRAIEKIHNFWKMLHGQNLEEQKEMQEYIRRGGDPVWWPEEWQRRISTPKEKGGLGYVDLTPTGEGGGTLGGGPTGGSSAPPQGKIYKKNPSTGKWE